MKKCRALQIILELAEKNMIPPEYASDDTELYDKMLVETDAYHTVYRMLENEVEEDKQLEEVKKALSNYKVPAHLRGEIDLKELKKDLDKLNEPLLGGVMNMCYGDGYFSKSLQKKYGKSIIELQKMITDFYADIDI